MQEVKYHIRRGSKYKRFFIYQKPNEYERGELYAVTWYFSLCDWMGNELDGFDNENEEITAIEEGYYNEDTQTLVYPIVNGKELQKNDLTCFNKLKQGMKTTLNGYYYKEY